MENKILSNALIRKIYDNGPDETKAELESVYGKEFFTTSIIDRIKTFDDAFFVWRDKNGKLDENRGRLILYDGPDELLCAARDNVKMWIIAEVLNEGWVPDWNNKNEYKYWPWFQWNGSDFGFSTSGTHYGNTCTYVGSRLCFKSKELAIYAGTNPEFLKIWNGFLMK